LSSSASGDWQPTFLKRPLLISGFCILPNLKLIKFNARSIEMKKVDDRNLTPDAIETMTAKEYQAFEKRLRDEATRQDKIFYNYQHPVRGDIYGAATSDHIHADGLDDIPSSMLEGDILAMRDYLFQGLEK
jgi:hypothetical protein